MSFDASDKSTCFGVLSKAVSDSELSEYQKKRDIEFSKRKSYCGSITSTRSDDYPSLKCSRHYSRKMMKGNFPANDESPFMKKFKHQTKNSELTLDVENKKKQSCDDFKMHSNSNSDCKSTKVQEPLDIFEESSGDESNHENFRQEECSKSKSPYIPASPIELFDIADEERGALENQERNETAYKHRTESFDLDEINSQNLTNETFDEQLFTGNQSFVSESVVEPMEKTSKTDSFVMKQKSPEDAQNSKKDANNFRNASNPETNPNEREEGELSPDFASPELVHQFVSSNVSNQDTSLNEPGLKNARDKEHAGLKLNDKVKDYIRKLERECRHIAQLDKTDPAVTMEFIKKTENYILDFKKNLSSYMNPSRFRSNADGKSSQVSKEHKRDSSKKENDKFRKDLSKEKITNLRSQKSLKSDPKENQNKEKSSVPENRQNSPNKNSAYKHIPKYVPRSLKYPEPSPSKARERKLNFKRNAIKSNDYSERATLGKQQANAFKELCKDSSHEKKRESNKTCKRTAGSTLDSIGLNDKPELKRSKRNTEYFNPDPKRTELTRMKTNAEKNRVRSLFKRQMNLITRHVVQKEEKSKTHFYMESDFRWADKSKELNTIRTQIDQFKPQNANFDVKNINNLDDMENFLSFLKEKKGLKCVSSRSQQDYLKKSANLISKFQNSASGNYYTLNSNLGHNDNLMHCSSRKSTSNTGTKLFPRAQENNPLNLSLNKEGMKLIGGLWKFGLESNLEKRRRKVLKNIGESSDSKENESHFCEYENNMSSKPSEETKGQENERLEKDSDVLERICTKGTKLSNDTKSKLRKNCTDKDNMLQCSDFKLSSKNEAESCHLKERKGNLREYEERNKSVVLSKEHVNHHTNSDGNLILKEKEHTKMYCASSSSSESDDENIDDIHAILPKGLKLKNLFIIGDKKIDLGDKKFRLRVIGNHLYLESLKKIPKSKFKAKRKKHLEESFIEQRLHSSKERKFKNKKLYSHEQNLNEAEICDMDEDLRNKTLEEMEDFLQQLRASSNILNEEEGHIAIPEAQTKEMKFLDRIHAQRKAKLMACVSDMPEKEAKFLKDFQMKIKGQPEGGLDVLSDAEKKKLMEKIKAETDAIVLAQKAGNKLYQSTSRPEELKDMRKLLTILRKKVESQSNETRKTFDVSFELKKSGKMASNSVENGEFTTKSVNQPACFAESQRFLNSVRAKLRAKKTLNSNK